MRTSSQRQSMQLSLRTLVSRAFDAAFARPVNRSWINRRSPALKVRDQSTRLGGFSYIPPIIAEARFQASDDLRFEATHMIRRFFSQATMKLLRQAKTNYPMSRPSFHQDKASDNRSYRQADDETSDNGNRDGHGDTTIEQNQENNNADGHAGKQWPPTTHTHDRQRARPREGESRGIGSVTIETGMESLANRGRHEAIGSKFYRQSLLFPDRRVAPRQA